MKVFTHGSIVNFQESAREMFVADLEQLIRNYQGESKKVQIGTIDLEQGEVRVFGNLSEVCFDVENDTCEFRFHIVSGEERNVLHSIGSLQLSHDATFDLFDEADETLSYQVVYITFQTDEEEKETTYFLAQEEGVKEPLACVVEFWQHASDIGRDVDFTIAGCRTKAFCDN